jgi:PfaD family protein
MKSYILNTKCFKEGVSMNPQDILQALQNGKISIDEAESELAGNKKEASSVNVEEGLEDKEILEHGLSEELNPKRLGNPVFQERYNCKWSYFAVSMYRGISSEELVITMGKANLLSFFGSAGFGLEELEEHIKNIQSGLGDGKPYGMCLISNLDNPKKEIEQVELFVRYNIPVIEAAAYSTVTAPLVYCRIKGIYRQGERIILPRRIIGKCSNLRIAQMFLSPPPGEIVNDLLKAGLIDSEEAELSRFIPLADDLAIEADSGGHTNQGFHFP